MRWWSAAACLLVVAACGSHKDYGDDYAEIHRGDGTQCVLKQWRFRYDEAYTPPTRYEGIRVTIPISPRYAHTYDDVLRIYGPAGERLELQRNQITRIRIDGGCEPSCRVARTTFETTTQGTVLITPPGEEPNAAVMPMADHFWPAHWQGDYRSFDGVGVKVEGTRTEGCQGVAFVSLSSVGRSDGELPTVVDLHAP